MFLNGLKKIHILEHISSQSTQRGRRFWPISEERQLMPPISKKMPGRPSKKRREPVEGKGKGTKKISKQGRVFKYGICHGEGHNKRCCQKRVDVVSLH